MRHFRSLQDPQLSPDGTRALLRVNDAAADGGKSHLWLIDVGGGMPRQLTFSPDADKQGEHSGQWMPDGQSILFLAHRTERTSLFILPMNGGEASQGAAAEVDRMRRLSEAQVVARQLPDRRGDFALL